MILEENNLYRKAVAKELEEWEEKIMKEPTLAGLLSKRVQTKTHSLMPKKIQDAITLAVKGMVESVLTASSYLTKTEPASSPSLAEGDFLVEKAYQNYYKTAVVQGVGFGLGGILINLADFPALLAVKTKFLFDCAKLYGFDIDDPSERVFMLYVFQLAFSSDRRRREILGIVKEWDRRPKETATDWKKLQMEYRDFLDISKLLQVLPVVGAVAGGVANYNLMQKLKVTAMNSYRLRLLSQERQKGEQPDEYI